ncbi:hypothetical protein, partial [Marinobacter lipolyticus]|uniref:hypothetical protein n=1 Tax=Marinobacter lipolyticus TaxID=209639 RepID=UPI001BD0BDAB
YALVTGLSNEEPAIIELLHEGPQRPLGVGLNLPKHGRNYPYNARHGDAFFVAASPPQQRRACWRRYT